MPGSDVHVRVRHDDRSTTGPQYTALPMVRLPARQRSNVAPSAVVILLVSCTGVAIFDVLLMLRGLT